MSLERIAVRISLAFVLAVGVTGAWAHDESEADAYSAIYVFGDSLSDGGNAAVAVLSNPSVDFQSTQFIVGVDDDLVPSAPYLLGDPFLARFSNGPVWVEQLAQREAISLSPSLLGGTNFAFGGANTGPLPHVLPNGVPTLRNQVDQLLSSTGGVVDPDALYVILGGGNDVLDALRLADPHERLQVLQASAANVRRIVKDLDQAGADHFLLGLVPNVGLTPQLRLAGLGERATTLSAVANFLYARELSRFRYRARNDLRVLNTFKLVSKILRYPLPFGFTNVTDPCISFAPPCAQPDGYAFWDGVHPTARVHEVVADAAQKVLDGRRRGKPAWHRNH